MDDILVNNGEQFILSAPLERIRKEQNEAAEANRDKGLIEDCIERIDKRIDEITGIQSIDLDVFKSAEDLRVDIRTRRNTVDELMSIRNWLQVVLDKSKGNI